MIKGLNEFNFVGSWCVSSLYNQMVLCDSYLFKFTVVENFCPKKLFLPSITVVEAVGVAQAASGRAGEWEKDWWIFVNGR